jgi:ribosomal protein L37AE/L43A
MNNKFCIWETNGIDLEIFGTSCDHVFYLSEGSIKDNEMKYCPYCGKEIFEEIEEDMIDGVTTEDLKNHFEEDFLDDGFGQRCSKVCEYCGQKTMQIHGAGDFRCSECYDKE